jgi:hypothetical protein
MQKRPKNNLHPLTFDVRREIRITAAKLPPLPRVDKSTGQVIERVVKKLMPYDEFKKRFPEHELQAKYDSKNEPLPVIVPFLKTEMVNHESELNKAYQEYGHDGIAAYANQILDIHNLIRKHIEDEENQSGQGDAPVETPKSSEVHPQEAGDTGL